MTSPVIEPSEFVAAVQPLLETHDTVGLEEMLHARWSREQLKAILDCDNLDARKVACLALGMIGGKCCISSLARQLRHPDAVVNQMAEHSLWALWMRSGVGGANLELCRGMKAMDERDLPRAIRRFTRAVELDPTFSEAYNQRAIAKYLDDRYRESIADCREAVRLMPCHFGAWAGMGHCYAHEGRLDAAAECYAQALEINPHLHTIRETLEELRQER